MSLNLQNIFSKFSRLRVIQTICNHGYHSSSVLGVKPSETYNMQMTPIQCSSQLDPAKIERKKRKIQKELRKLMRKGQRILKPVEERTVWPKLKREINLGVRTRNDKEDYSSEELEANVLLIKEWGRYRQLQDEHEREVIGRVMKCQERALKKLLEESEELYLKAIELDDSVFEYKSNGPVETPPKDNYDAQDGHYFDKTEYFKQEKVFMPDDGIKQAYIQSLKKQKMG